MANDGAKDKWPSYTMVEPRMRRIYFRFYQETYKTSVLDRKTKELIAIAASLATHCKRMPRRPYPEGHQVRRYRARVERNDRHYHGRERSGYCRSDRPGGGGAAHPTFRGRHRHTIRNRGKTRKSCVSRRRVKIS